MYKKINFKWCSDTDFVNRNFLHMQTWYDIQNQLYRSFIKTTTTMKCKKNLVTAITKLFNIFPHKWNKRNETYICRLTSSSFRSLTGRACILACARNFTSNTHSKRKRICRNINKSTDWLMRYFTGR